jgi:hypothetical protein
MRTLIFALIPTLLAACANDVVALTDAEGSSTAGPGSTEPTSDPTSPTSTSPGTTVSTSTSGPGTSVGSDTATATATSITSDATSSTSNDTGTTTTDTTGTSTTDPGTSSSTTGVMLGCGMDGPEIDATLVHLGVDPGCGPLEFKGQNNTDSSGPVYALDGCPCGANCLIPDPWTFTLDMPLEWLPGKLPICPRIVVERQKSKQGCELVGVAIWDAQEPADALARFYAGSLLGPLAAAKPGLKVEQIVAEECDCDNCCNIPTRLDLKFSIAQKSGTLAEGEELQLSGGEGDTNAYEIKNFQSHLSGICDDSPHIDWVMRKLPPAP